MSNFIIFSVEFLNSLRVCTLSNKINGKVNIKPKVCCTCKLPHRLYVERERLDRRRLLEAHFKYAVLTVISWYPEFFQDPVVSKQYARNFITCDS